MRRLVRELKALHRDERGIEGLEKLLVIAAITLPLLGLLIVFRNELWDWVKTLWGTTLEEGNTLPS